LPIATLKNRQRPAQIAGWIFFIAIMVIVIELHTRLLRFVFESHDQVFFKVIYDYAKTYAVAAAPIVVAVLPFLKTLAAKAVASDSGTWADLAKRIASRVILIVVASFVPLLLWLAMMQLAVWGTAVSVCHEPALTLAACARDQITNKW